MSRILLIDGDMVAFRVAAAEEKPLDFGETFILSADADNGRKNLDLMVEGWIEKLGADAVLMTLTDSSNYRKSVMPSYKSNRDGIRRPMILAQMREYLVEKYGGKIVPTLEADDVLGILATHPKLLKEHDEKVIVTWDKDLRTIPGLHWNPTNDAETGPVEVKLRDADNTFYAQILSGDAVDGYPGCPGIGKKRAEQIVAGRVFTYPSTEEVKRGPNKGTERTIWKVTTNPNPWACVVAQYEKAGLTMEDALQTARVARILRAEDYDFKKKEPKLWTPR